MNAPKIKPLAGKNKYINIRDYPFKHSGGESFVPRGFIYNGASIPFFAWVALYTPYSPKVAGPALVHDYLFYSHEVSFHETNRLFRQHLLDNFVPRWKATLMYYAVKSFTKGIWERKLQQRNDFEARIVPDLV